MARERPIKLHIKDGKDTAFRLIGPKGRVLNTLLWDGETLELTDVSDVEDVPVESLNNVDEAEETSNDADPLNAIQDTQIDSPVDAPEPMEDQPVELGEIEGVADVSGDSESPMSDEELADILESDTPKDDEEGDEAPEEPPHHQEDHTESDPVEPDQPSEDEEVEEKKQKDK